MSVHCSFVVTCWERVDLLALVCNVLLCCCHFPVLYPGSGVVLQVLFVLISDLCHLALMLRKGVLFLMEMFDTWKG